MITSRLGSLQQVTPMTLILFGLLSMSTSALAKSSDCQAMKPTQSLLTEEAKALSVGASAAVVGTGKGSAKVKKERETSYNTRLLDDETLAQAWFQYTQCLQTSGNTVQRAMALKELGMSPEEYSQWAEAFDTAQGSSSVVMIGSTAAGVGAAIGTGTYFYGKSNNQMHEGPWGVLTALNVTGWAIAGAGAGMVTYAMLKDTSAPAIYPTLGGIGLSGRF